MFWHIKLWRSYSYTTPVHILILHFRSSLCSHIRNKATKLKWIKMTKNLLIFKTDLQLSSLNSHCFFEQVVTFRVSHSFDVCIICASYYWGDHNHTCAAFTEFMIVFYKATLWFFVACSSVCAAGYCRNRVFFVSSRELCSECVCLCVVLIVLWCYCEVHGHGAVLRAPLWSSILQTQC